MKIKKIIASLGIIIIGLGALCGCQKNNVDVVGTEKLDEIRVIVSDKVNDNNKEKNATVKDLQEQDKIINDIKAIFDNEQPKRIDKDEVDIGKEYQIELFKENKLIQKYLILNNTVEVDEQEYTIDKKNEVKLDNLKKHLLKIVD